MKNFFSLRHTRYTAIVMVFVWLMTLGIGIANACLLNEAPGHHTYVAQVQATHHEEVNEQTNASDKAVCLTVCEAEQTAAVKNRLVDVASDSQTAPIATCSALTVILVDLNDRVGPSVVPVWRELPMSIRFLRLTI